MGNNDLSVSLTRKVEPQTTLLSGAAVVTQGPGG
jgi:hypothetical protein